jgi:hypothetical protein
MTANFNESQMFDSGDGKHFGIKIQLPAQAPFEGLGMVNQNGWRLPLYDNGPIAPDGDYWLLVKGDGTVNVWPVSEHPVNTLGSFGFFVKQNGVAFVTPHNEAWPMSSFGFVYCAK